MRIPGIEAERSEPKGAEVRGVALAVVATAVLAVLIVGAAWIAAVAEPEEIWARRSRRRTASGERGPFPGGGGADGSELVLSP